MTKTIVLILVFGVLGVPMASAAEKKVQMKDLPPAVQKAVQQETAAKGAALVGLTQEVEDGKTVYEIETKAGGRGRDVTVDASGAVVCVEQEVALESIPAPARAALEKAAAGGRITKVETVTKGTAVTYEAAITKKGKKKSEFTVAADGSAVK